jgi:hypothetical protein
MIEEERAARVVEVNAAQHQICVLAGDKGASPAPFGDS